jgi:hypothetical protein
MPARASATASVMPATPPPTISTLSAAAMTRSLANPSAARPALHARHGERIPRFKIAAWDHHA